MPRTKGRRKRSTTADENDRGSLPNAPWQRRVTLISATVEQRAVRWSARQLRCWLAPKCRSPRLRKRACLQLTWPAARGLLGCQPIHSCKRRAPADRLASHAAERPRSTLRSPIVAFRRYVPATRPHHPRSPRARAPTGPPPWVRQTSRSARLAAAAVLSTTLET